MALEDPVVLELKVRLDSQVGMEFPVVLELKVKGETLEFRDLLELVCPHKPPRVPKEIQDSLVHPDPQVRKASLVSPVTPDCPDQTDAQDFPGHKVLREILVSPEAQEVLEVQVQRATWERWASQDPLD